MENPSTQVAAKVGNGDVTIQEVTRSLRDDRGRIGAEGDIGKALEKLIDQKLLVQRALENRLDRDPEVIQAIEEARGQVLAQAYIQRWVTPRSPISEKDAREFYDQNADLFEQRRVYRLHAFYIDSFKPDESLKMELDQSRTPDAVRAVLNKHHVVFNDDIQVMPVELLPMELVGTFGKAKVGDIVAAPTVRSTSVFMQILDVQDQPIAWRQAKSLIEAYLTHQRSQQAVEAHLKGLRAATKIQYFGEFAASQDSVRAEKSAGGYFALAPAANNTDNLKKPLFGVEK